MERVVFVSDAPRVAGSEIWLRTYLPHLRAYGFAPELHLGPAKALDPFQAHLEAQGLKVFRHVHLLEVASAPPARLYVLQSWSGGLYARLASRLPGVRVAVVHDQLEYFYPWPGRPLYRGLYLWTKGRFLKGLDGAITVSRWGAEWLKRWSGLEAWAVPNGVDVRRFYPDPARRAQARQALGLSLERPVVAVVGRMAPEKNPWAALATARLLPGVEFAFAGDDDSTTGFLIKALARAWRLRNVRFLGRVENTPDLYRAADLLLQPTLAENQSLVTLEAMSSGLPVITTPIPAQAELVAHGQEGLLLPPKPSALAQGVRALLEDPGARERMGEKARARVLAGHTLEGSVAALAQALWRILEAHPLRQGRA